MMRDEELPMLLLDSPRWATLKASPGGTGQLAARLLESIRAGAFSEFGELYHQCCHQLTVGEVAYAAVPHVVDIARQLPVRDQIEPLGIAGTVRACVSAFPSEAPPIPDDLREAYEESSRFAIELATAALRQTGWRRGEVTELLAIMAAFQGDCDLAIFLFLHGGSDQDLSCPECGEYIRWREDGSSDSA